MVLLPQASKVELKATPPCPIILPFILKNFPNIPLLNNLTLSNSFPLSGNYFSSNSSLNIPHDLHHWLSSLSGLSLLMNVSLSNSTTASGTLSRQLPNPYLQPIVNYPHKY
jgi:hypothetical protein